LREFSFLIGQIIRFSNEDYYVEDVIFNGRYHEALLILWTDIGDPYTVNLHIPVWRIT